MQRQDKLLITIFLALLLMIPITYSIIIDDDTPFIAGDVNGDEIIDSADANLTTLYVIDPTSISNSEYNFMLKAADINLDGKIKMNDAMRILNNDLLNIDVSLESTNVYVGTTKQITPTITGGEPEEVSLSWKSSNPEVASIDKNGVITGNKTGTVTIAAITSDGKKHRTKVNVVGERLHFISGTSENVTTSGDSTEGTSGSAILIESKGHYAMIDTQDKSAWSQVNSYLKSQNVTTLSFIMLTHMHGDHVGNFSNILNNYTVKKVYMKKYCQDGNEDDQYDNLYDCSDYNLTITDQDTCTLHPSDEATSLEKVAVISAKAHCFINKYNREHPGNEISITYLNYIPNINKFKDKTFTSLDFTMSLYNQKLVPASKANISENYNSIITVLNSKTGKVAILPADSYSTSTLNDAVAEVRTNTETIDILDVPHHGSRYCALLPEDDIETTLKTGVNNYVITSSTTRLQFVMNTYANPICMSVFQSPTSSNKNYVDECTYDIETGKYSNGAIVADMTGDTVTMKKIIDGTENNTCTKKYSLASE